MPWSAYLDSLAPHIFPNDVHDFPRRFTAVGIDIAILGIFVSSAVRHVLEHRWLMWLGKHSFAVYLIHGTILRTIGIWIVYGISGEPWTRAEKDQEQVWLHKRGTGWVWVSMGVFVGLTYAGAWLWMRYVDEACARATQWIEIKLFASDDEDGDVEKGVDGDQGLGRLLLGLLGGEGVWRSRPDGP
jgi:peptidoglycan/LPS O-acetylase OafA/YrhL